MRYVYVVGTADTKGAELAYLADRIAHAGVAVLRVDVGTRAPSVDVDIAAGDVARHHPDGAQAVLEVDDRGAAVSAMATAFSRFSAGRNDIAGMIGIGGGGGTSIITAGMRELPYGLPKIMVSTLASGDVAPYVDISDIIMMPSVSDFAGLNRLSRMILHNAAEAMAGMVRAPHVQTDGLPSIGLTMFGVTTHGVTATIDHLKDRFDCMVFHATGVGGRTMEKLVDDRVLAGVLDITTTEVCDMLVGGVLPATPERFDAIARTGVPYVGSAGALDMVNFWAPETVPAGFAGRRFYHHNSNVTLMRTSADECRQIGTWIGRKLSACNGPLRFLIPEKGVSALDIEDGAFFDPEADEALFSALESAFEPSANRRIERLPLHINDPAFARAAADAFLSII
ncbi:MAG: Tm-1-like ATP-binding domain-containing protein [Hoeflea sp.]|uniref:Tm-1-like ATP-binding domain-containing protein n=1 Tax=Hoeflea sp. TaxID=1940281 RepID=UPI001D2C648E|nr:Tm-1-like ATP-binding domain-containing protein [Hoeflea sp.]MBU4531918.1 Tm-1-like ATP-binding domain-containing protein [Alphaproteobacteria bacterium]MBU4546340.1 Tm-1-like ATP-binding domain-containing protein [Alphaproteobacteria bacterium]MBU4549469.1 Tm-1-like ATP-binding domain-containing protein [Alphaproteobacteria bacterium]MBV1722644.1 Tm-1-like ATP-binding domain-containing protein [Hoeflea sp.]MBV1782582.1 Tm-1-like ATP-binding domain-containing protein [Hoeflea sp.]